MANPEWLILFDTGERDHVVDLILAKDDGVRHGLPISLIPLLDAYCKDNEQTGISIDIEAAREFRATVADVCLDLDPVYKAQRWAELMSGPSIGGDGETYLREKGFTPEQLAVLKDDATRIKWKQCAERISSAWTKFIAAGAGHLQYSEKPKQREARAKGGKGKSRKQLDLINRAIQKYDPGPGTSTNKNTKKSRVATILKKADEEEFPGREKLPIRLDKYLR